MDVVRVDVVGVDVVGVWTWCFCTGEPANIVTYVRSIVYTPSNLYTHCPSPIPHQLKKLNLQQLEEHMLQLDNHLDQELESLRQRYHSKREPILAAMDAKKRQQTRM